VTAIKSTDMTNILDASSAIIAPYPTANLTAKISCVVIDKNGAATVAWSAATTNGTPRAIGSSITIPAALANPNSQLILGEASYVYKPVIGYTITGSVTLSDKMYMAPRVTAPSYGDGTSAIACI
jgi:Flp pilus assembly protein TadG